MGTGSFVPVRAFICVVRRSVRLLSVLRDVRDRRRLSFVGGLPGRGPWLRSEERYFFGIAPRLGDRAQKSALPDRTRLYISHKCLLISTGYIFNILV